MTAYSIINRLIFENLSLVETINFATFLILCFCRLYLIENSNRKYINHMISNAGKKSKKFNVKGETIAKIVRIK